MIANSSIIDTRIDFPSATIIMNRPSRKNAVSVESINALSQAFADFHQEKKVAAVILTGANDSFCAGTDLKDLNTSLEEESAQERWYEETMAMNELLVSMLRFPKPIISAVNGPAMGFGFALALASDLIVAGPSAVFGCPEVKRGLVPGMVAPLLAFRVGAAAAAHYSLTGKTASAQEAFDTGFCHELVDNDDVVWAKANEIAGGINNSSPQSIQMTKQLINETIGETFFTNLNLGTANSAAARTTESAKEGVSAFIAKRKPKWY